MWTFWNTLTWLFWKRIIVRSIIEWTNLKELLYTKYGYHYKPIILLKSGNSTDFKQQSKRFYLTGSLPNKSSKCKVSRKTGFYYIQISPGWIHWIDFKYLTNECWGIFAYPSCHSQRTFIFMLTAMHFEASRILWYAPLKLKVLLC